jgi:hypothetical protein
MWRTQEGDEYLATSYNQGQLTTRQLAAEFGVSQAMLMRRAKKLGVTKSRREAQFSKVREPIVGVVRSERPSSASLPCLDIEPILPFAVPRVPQQAARKLASTYIAPGGSSPFKTCQWIESAQPTSAPMCGCKTIPGKSWCEAHYRRVFHHPGRPSGMIRADEAA